MENQLLSHPVGRQIVVGDIHGCFATFKALLEDKIQITQDDQLILLGDIINRGPSSRKVLDYLLTLELSHEVYCIRGNHEHNFLIAYECGVDFFEQFLSECNAEDLLEGDVHTYLDFCARMPYFLETPTHLLSHMGFSSDFPPRMSDTRSFFHQQKLVVNLAAINSKKQVHGHVVKPLNYILEEVRAEKKQITIDGGCWYGERDGLGYLCALDLNSNELFTQKNKEPIA